MTNSNNSFSRGSEVFFSPRGVMAIELPLNEEISGGGKKGEKEKVGSAIRRKRANRESINVQQKRRGRGYRAWRRIDCALPR